MSPWICYFLFQNIYGIWDWGLANSFWDLVIQISIIEMKIFVTDFSKYEKLKSKRRSKNVRWPSAAVLFFILLLNVRSTNIVNTFVSLDLLTTLKVVLMIYKIYWCVDECAMLRRFFFENKLFYYYYSFGSARLELETAFDTTKCWQLTYCFRSVLPTKAFESLWHAGGDEVRTHGTQPQDISCFWSSSPGRDHTGQNHQVTAYTYSKNSIFFCQ